MRILLFGIVSLFLFACTSPEGTSPSSTEMTDVPQILSPDGRLQLEFFLDEQGRPMYRLLRDEAPIIRKSALGFALRDADSLARNFEMVEQTTGEFDESWRPVWGEDAEVRNHYRQLSVRLQERDGDRRQLALVFRLYDDGLGFRYEIPEQPAMEGEILIEDELTEFALTGDHTAWWIPGDWDIYEHLFNKSRLSEVDAGAKRDNPNLAQTYIPDPRAVNTPLTLRTDGGLHLAFHEAALYDYAGMTLHIGNGSSPTLRSALVAWPDGVKVRTRAPFVTPWRTVQVGEQAGDLIESKLIVNLNEPNKLGTPDWIEPMKYVGIWWEMHLGKGSWDMASGKHAATTENAKRYIDFAAAHGIRGLLVEGWNTGWENWFGEDRPDKPFDFVTPYADFDMEEVVRYGREEGVAIIGHHETSALVTSYEEQMDTAYKYYQNLGIHAVKTGYVGKIRPRGQYHHGQFMVRHYQKTVEEGAKHEIMVNIHEPIKATGIRRTWPNLVAREGLRGQEFNAWGTPPNPPEHTVIVAFTRMLGGPIDFTPGIFDIKFDDWKKDNQVSTTLAKQLALYVVLYGPLQMAADLPENYEGHPAFQFISDVAVDWEQSRVLNGEVGEYVTIARREKGGDRWFIGSITNEAPRQFELPLDFLKPGRSYTATLYTDAADAHWDDNPTAYEISKQTLTAEDVLSLRLAPGGGAAVVLE